MAVVKITMPTKDDRLVEWEGCVIAYREKEKQRWLAKNAPTNRVDSMVCKV
jgi:hypothetical protein